ncbi:hypothetical protein [Kangiella shandongensis]|uniref:hypothetical protein n=1 Tax=Kangiella shandongensis TaxID=2763258 RepID=UPI001CC16C33|nr:hypothetical protein [Kangiella shandongensis]
MNIRNNKPNLLCSAFLSIATVFFLVEPSEAKISCYGMNFSDTVTRSDITGSAGSDQSSPLSAAKAGSLVSGTVDLNISIDIATLINNQVTIESADWVWYVEANPSDGLSGNITADYQFLSATGSNDQICSDSNVNSCMTVVGVEPIAEVERRKTSGRHRGNILESSAGVRLTLDLSELETSGNYSAQVLIDLYHDGSSLACSN